MSRILLLRFLVASGIVSAVCGVGQCAATPTQTIKGMVVDPSGGPLMGGVVSLVRLNRHQERETVATGTLDEEGGFRLQFRSHGHHELTVKAWGFRPVTIKLNIARSAHEVDVGTVKVLNVNCSEAICDDFVSGKR